MSTSFIDSPAADQALAALYGMNEVPDQRRRYKALTGAFRKAFASEPSGYFSSPGRTEISGNHTDHNGGKVLTASINLDIIAAVQPTSDMIITLESAGYKDPFVIDLKDTARVKGETSTIALVRGVAAGFEKQGLKFGGFNAYIESRVANGAGISSSAAFEMLLSQIFNYLYNDPKVDTVVRAQIGQFAENHYWDKPSGLLDQMACGVGGLVFIDFCDREHPIVKRVDYDFSKKSVKLLLVDTGDSHSDLTAQYAQIPLEMWDIASQLGKKRCIDVTEDAVTKAIPQLRDISGDRAVLRALHFFAEDARVVKQVRALEEGNFQAFLQFVTDSGSSSWRLLQNCYDPAEVRNQSIPLALGLTERFFAERNAEGAFRVHGGGFAGMVLVVIADELVEDYQRLIEPIFGKGSTQVMTIRPLGAVSLEALAH